MPKLRAAVIELSGLAIQADTAQQVLEPRVGAHRVEAGPHEDRRVEALSVGFL